MSQASELDAIQDILPEKEVPCQLLVGKAGCGKSHTILQRCSEDESYGIITSSTGVSAVNLGATTLNSCLGYFDTASMRDSYLQGHLTRRVHAIAKDYRRIILDEMSMTPAEQLTYLYRAVRDANGYRDVEQPMGILLTGDFCQLPPVNAPWIFESPYWPRFQANQEILTKNWRQGDPRFVDALNAVRSGDGGLGAELLSAYGIRWEVQRDVDFEGTTILPDNASVSRHNEAALDRVSGQSLVVYSRRWGRQRSEWGENKKTREWGIPPRMELKIGSYVMILSNYPDGNGGFYYVNGDCGWIRAHVLATNYVPEHFVVELVRGGDVCVWQSVRSVETDTKPESFSGPTIIAKDDHNVYMEREHYRAKNSKYVLGQIQYWPLRLAYASTVHKSQSLTLDRCQIDFRGAFVGKPAMLYVALSRCKSLAGLRLVGDRETFAKRVAVDERVRGWL
jgi:ATP-dependent DNA helicase PIF1